MEKKMIGYIIKHDGNDSVNEAYSNLLSSIKIHAPYIEVERYTPSSSDVSMDLMSKEIRWNYPFIQSEYDFVSGLQKSVYQCRDETKVISCALAHYSIWKKISETEASYVFEYDSIFTKRLPVDFISNTKKYDIIGINSPFKATRKSNEYHSKVQAESSEIARAPEIDDISIPQGIAGNSAYCMSPLGAQHMLNLVDRYGLWPNDAIMCRQLVPGLFQSKTYYTIVQNVPSTTRG